jgi:hypothetical protein
MRCSLVVRLCGVRVRRGTSVWASGLSSARFQSSRRRNATVRLTFPVFEKVGGA